MHPQIPEVITGESIHRVTPTRLFGPHDTFLTTVAYSDDGLRMVTGDIGGNLRIWEVETGQLVARQRVFTTSVLGAVNLLLRPTIMPSGCCTSGQTIRSGNRAASSWMILRYCGWGMVQRGGLLLRVYPSVSLISAFT